MIATRSILVIVLGAGLAATPALHRSPDGADGEVLPASVAGPAQADRDALRKIAEPFEKKGIHLDLDSKLCSIAVTVDIRDDLIEYILVSPRGAAHESLFSTLVPPTDLNAALLLLGVQPGSNARWIAKEPAPTQEEMRAGVAPYDVEPPRGDGLYLYAAWRTSDETFLFRVEDLMRNLDTGRSMRRHRWVYLGSRFLRTRKDSDEEVFAAELDGNLINLAYFEQGYTLLTAALPECLKQTIWLPNAWIVPERGTAVTLIFSRQRMSALPAGLEAGLPLVPE